MNDTTLCIDLIELPIKIRDITLTLDRAERTPYPYIPVHTNYEVLEGVFLSEKNPNLFSAFPPSSSSFNEVTPF
jgi:hypothetical protein